MQLLASDLNNPEFVGATNPDSMLHVEFFMHEPIDKWGSEEASYREGRKVTIKLPGGPRPFVRIMRPGDQTSMVEVEVREEHKRRFPQQWLYFEMSEGLHNEGSNIPGWRLEDWPAMSDRKELVRDLNFRRFYTVEQLAGASDGQIQGIGIGGLGLREEARQALRDKTRAEIGAAVAEKDAELRKMQEQMAAMQEQMAAVLAAQQQAPAADEPPAKRRGRPPKEAAA